MPKFLFKLLPVLSVVFISTKSFAQKINSKTSNISFYSHTAVEDIKASNTASVSVLDPTTGDVVFSVPMQSFDFEKALMQKHFNSPDFLDTKTEPKAKLVGKITNLSKVNFKIDGIYSAEVSGEMTIKGISKPFTAKSTITIKGSSFEVESKFEIILEDYGIAFKKGKPSTNIAKTIQITVLAEY
ncbi:MAG: YceI family protein [Bacteroidetes bacterium]|nr:YceI family protein [Bacteroidota bacterium]